jgi:hypothetical protein
MSQPVGTYLLVGSDGKLHGGSSTKGTIGGHRGRKVFGRPDCPSALRAIERGGYVRDQRSFGTPERAELDTGRGRQTGPEDGCV